MHLVNDTKHILKKHSRIFGIIVAVLITVLIFVFRDKMVSLKGYGYLGLFLLNIFGSATIFLPTPLFLTAFAAASFLNPFLVALIASLGSAIGEFTGYMAGYGAEKLLENDIKIRKVKGWMDKYGLWALFVLSAIPNPFFDLSGIVAGATGIPIRKYLVVVWAGKFIKFGVIVFLGTSSVGLMSKFF